MQKLITILLLPVVAALIVIKGASITGKVSDENHNPLSGVSIVFTSKDTTITTLTDATGVYKAQLPTGDYQITASLPGYTSGKQSTLKVRGRDLQYNFRLAMIPVTEPLVEEPKKTVEELVSTKDSQIPENDEAPPALDDTRHGDVILQNTEAGNVSGHYEIVPTSIPKSEAKAVNPGYSTKMVKASSSTAASSGKPAPNPYLGNAVTLNSPSFTRPASSGAPKEQQRRYENGIQLDSVIPESGTEQYNKIVENPFVQVKDQAFSTFSIDVDAASYSNVRRFINSGQRPPADAVRVEEMINYFDYQYPQPTGSDPIRIITELGKCPWNADHHLLMVGLQGRSIEQQQAPPSNLVFLVDVSGSMSSPDKLPLVQQSLHLLLNQLRPTDRVALVTYAGNTEVALPSTPASDKATIKAAIDKLGAGGSTAGAAGITLAYQTARTNFMQQGNNRVILCTDGDFNVGLSSEKELVDMIEKERKSGVYLTVLGFGRGNYQDGKMQELADRGNGNHAYIDQISEAKKVLVKEFAGTLFTIAKDVKLQLEFNPDQVSSYRLIGYENRMLAKEDFDNDAKDAGELGANHTVTALYEIVPNVQSNGAGDLVKLKFRYKPSTGEQSSLLVQQTVPAVCAAKMSDNFNFASAVAEFGLLLRNSTYKGSANWEEVIRNASKGLSNDKEGYRAEFVKLTKLAMSYKR